MKTHLLLLAVIFLLLALPGCDKKTTDIEYPSIIVTIKNASLPTSTLTTGVQIIHRFKISADPVEAIAWRRIIFQIDTVNAVATDFSLVNLYGDTIAPCHVDGNLVICLASGDHRIMPGTTQQYDLKANVVCGLGPASVSSSINRTNSEGPEFFSSLPAHATFVWCKITGTHNSDGHDYFTGGVSEVAGLPLVQALSK